MFALRDYQTKAVADLREAMRQHDRALLVAPTGSGKTVIFSFIASSVADRGKRIVIVAHRQEIVDQISRALAEMGVRHGVIAPGRTATADPVQVAMIQTLAKRLDRIPKPDLLIIDEAHHGVAGSWRKVAEAWRDPPALAA